MEATSYVIVISIILFLVSCARGFMQVKQNHALELLRAKKEYELEVLKAKNAQEAFMVEFRVAHGG